MNQKRAFILLFVIILTPWGRLKAKESEAMQVQTKHTNRLIQEASPYLQQHAHNPVDWYPWGPEAFEKAKRQNKPIFLSIGYSTCHWCHVMAHESFENERIAKILNENFISIKVDREELPGVDAVYMDFVQKTTGSIRSDQTQRMLKEIRAHFLPRVAVLVRDPETNADELDQIAAMVKAHKPIDGKVTVYLCEDFVCRQPITTSDDFRKAIKALQ